MGTGKRNNWRANATPGPGNYNPLTKHHQSSPGWRLGTASRSVDHRSDTPGPGSYNSPGKISTTNPQYGFGGKSAQSFKSITPGPGTYDSNSLKGYENKPPSYSFGAKTNLINDKTKVPGPGTYEQTSRIQNQASPAYGLGSAKRDGLYRSSATPGPGMYAVRPSSAFNKESGPKYGFGSATRDDINGLAKTAPGPGTYEFKGVFESPGKGTSLVPRRPDSALFSAGRTPGPGAYEPSLSTKNKGPSYRIGSASRDTKDRAFAPGPGNYEPRSIQGNQNIKIGTSQRAPLSANKNTPGPGTYEYSLKVGEGPKYIMNPRREDNNQGTRYVPGPGAYTPAVELVKEKSPGVRMGSSNRSDLHGPRLNPGPGQYDVRGNLAGPKWGFGSDQRGRDYKSTVPGPGSYNLPTTVGDVPKYAYGNGQLKIHL